jgi:hypothetical protein
MGGCATGNCGTSDCPNGNCAAKAVTQEETLKPVPEETVPEEQKVLKVPVEPLSEVAPSTEPPKPSPADDASST